MRVANDADARYAFRELFCSCRRESGWYRGIFRPLHNYAGGVFILQTMKGDYDERKFRTD